MTTNPTTTPTTGNDQYDKPRKFLVTCDGAPFGGYDTYDEARAVVDMYTSPSGRPKPTSKRFDITPR